MYKYTGFMYKTGGENYEEEIFISLCSNNDDHGLSLRMR
jgi:hypothetical protein